MALPMATGLLRAPGSPNRRKPAVYAGSRQSSAPPSPNFGMTRGTSSVELAYARRVIHTDHLGRFAIAAPGAHLPADRVDKLRRSHGSRMRSRGGSSTSGISTLECSIKRSEGSVRVGSMSQLYELALDTWEQDHYGDERDPHVCNEFNPGGMIVREKVAPKISAKAGGAV
mmetsp:Transcript_98750/g.226914  ORF Transcript_98750/g.226914 Transcript_98750/m.226914 type:complete len:171 (-) Transcript_98750:81-593(-)